MPLIKYTSPNVKGYNGKVIWIELGFLKTIQAIDDCCKNAGFIFWVTSAFRKETDVIHGAVVNPATMSNHKVGHAIDGNLQHIATGEWFNSLKMGDKTGIDQQLIEAITAHGVRFGGNFRKADNVHFDDALNLRDPQRWRELYLELQG